MIMRWRSFALIGLALLGLGAAAQPALWEPWSDGLGVDAMPNANAAVRAAEGTLFLGTEQGLFRRTGSSWTRVVQSPLAGSRITGLQRDASGRLWAIVNDVGLWASDDHGATWHPDGPEASMPRGMNVATDGSLIVFGTVPNSNASQVFKKSDGDWQAMPPIPSTWPAHALAAVPDGRLVVSTSQGLFALDAEGVAWAPLPGFPGPLFPVHPVAVLQDGTWLAGTFSNSSMSPPRLYRSLDAGATWEVVAPISVRAVMPLQDGSAFVMQDGVNGRGLQRYVDGVLESVTVQTAEGIVPAIRTLVLGDPEAADPADRLHWVGGHGPLSGAFLTGTALVSPDLTVWTEDVAGAVTLPEVYSLTQAADGTVYAGHARGLSRRAPGAHGWQPVSLPTSAQARYVEATDEGVWLVTTSGVFFSDGADGDWEVRHTPSPNAMPRLAVRLEDGSLLVAESILHSAAQTHLIRSVDGFSWTPVRTMIGFPHVLVALPGNGAFLQTREYSGEFGVGRWRTLDIEGVWSFLGDATPPMSMESGPAGLFATVGFHALRSTNLGASWEQLGIPGRVSAYSEADWLHVGRNGYPVRRSSDAGATWADVGSGYLGGTFTAHVALSDGRVMVGNDMGVVRSVEPFVSSEPAPNGAVVLSVVAFPNPATGSARVRFVLPAADEASVVVYDLLGRRMAVLAEGSFTAGTHEVVWVTGAMAAGVYLVRLTTPQGALAKRVTVLP